MHDAEESNSLTLIISNTSKILCFLLKDVSSFHNMASVRLEHTEAFIWSLMLVYSNECVAGVDYQRNYRQER
jgi:hypothetical protein